MDGEPLRTDTKLDWCGDALCGMGVIRSLSRLISNSLGGVAGPCFSAKNNDSDGTGLVFAWHSEPSEEAMEEGGDERGQAGTLDQRGEDRRM